MVDLTYLEMTRKIGKAPFEDKNSTNIKLQNFIKNKNLKFWVNWIFFRWGKDDRWCISLNFWWDLIFDIVFEKGFFDGPMHLYRKYKDSMILFMLLTLNTWLICFLSFLLSVHQFMLNFYLFDWNNS